MMYYEATDKIEAYLQGELSPAESRGFEDLISTDPLLRNEVQFQKDIIGVVQENRRMALKKRLSQIELPAAQPSPFAGSFKAVVVAVSSLILIGLAWVVYTNTNQNTHNDITKKTDISVHKNTDLADKKSVEEQRSTSELKQQPLDPTKYSTENTNTKKQSQAPKIYTEKQVDDKKTTASVPKPNKSFKYQLFYQYENAVLTLMEAGIEYQLLKAVDAGEGVKDYILVESSFFELKSTNPDQVLSLKDSEVKNAQVHDRLLEIARQELK